MPNDTQVHYVLLFSIQITIKLAKNPYTSRVLSLHKSYKVDIIITERLELH